MPVCPTRRVWVRQCPLTDCSADNFYPSFSTERLEQQGICVSCEGGYGDEETTVAVKMGKWVAMITNSLLPMLSLPSFPVTLFPPTSQSKSISFISNQ
jgi:hypothetical protein